MDRVDDCADALVDGRWHVTVVMRVMETAKQTPMLF
jgi:hypothetical protein